MFLASLAGAACWFALYALIRDFAPPWLPRTPPFMKRYVSVSHALVVTTVSILRLLGAIGDTAWDTLMGVPMGYLLYDMYFVAYETETREAILVLHHFVFMFFLVTVAPAHREIAAQGLLSELTQPALHLCWGMIKTRTKDTYPLVFWVSSVYLLLTFVFARVVNFLYLAGRIWGFCPSLGAACSPALAGSAFFVAANIYWTGVLLRKALSPTITAD